MDHLAVLNLDRYMSEGLVYKPLIGQIGLWPTNLHLPLHCSIVLVVKVRLKGLFQKMLMLGGKIRFIEQSDLGKFKD